jgi:hypothetical protein
MLLPLFSSVLWPVHGDRGGLGVYLANLYTLLQTPPLTLRLPPQQLLTELCSCQCLQDLCCVALRDRPDIRPQQQLQQQPGHSSTATRVGDKHMRKMQASEMPQQLPCWLCNGSTQQPTAVTYLERYL